MHRGFIFQWRKDIDSEIWDKPPLYYKVWEWLNLSVDRKTGAIDRTLRQIADAVMWHERGAPRIPNPKTISDILAYLEDRKMVTKEIGGSGNARYLVITICDWYNLQHPEKCLSNTGETEEVTQNGFLYKKYQEEQQQEALLGKAVASPIEKVSEEVPDKKISKQAARLENLKTSPHWDFIQRLSTWFYELPDTMNPTGTERLSAQMVVEQVLRLDMTDKEGCETRLGHLVAWAVKNDFWQANLLSLGSLRDKKDKNAPKKWENIEAHMKLDGKESRHGNHNGKAPQGIGCTFGGMLDKYLAEDAQQEGAYVDVSPDSGELPALGPASGQ